MFPRQPCAGADKAVRTPRIPGSPCGDTIVERRAFTLIELLVVLATIALLGMMILPVLAAPREKSFRVQCESNLQQLWLALQIYGNENLDRPPQGNLGQHNGNYRYDLHAGSALWDLPNGSANKLINAGAKRSFFFCPGQETAVRESVFWWYYSGTNGPDHEGVYKGTGYYWMFDRGDTSHRTNPNFGGPYANTTNNIRALVKNMTVAPSTNFTVATTELIADFTISEGLGANSKWGNVISANSGTVIDGITFSGYRTSHLQGNSPAGGNILFLDGHVAWRPFREMGWVVKWSTGRYFWL